MQNAKEKAEKNIKNVRLSGVVWGKRRHVEGLGHAGAGEAESRQNVFKR